MYEPAPIPGKNKAIASMVLGIVSLVFAWFGWFAIAAIIMAVIGIVLAINAKKDMAAAGIMEGRGMATAGLVCSIIALALGAIVFISCVICVSAITSLPWSSY